MRSSGSRSLPRRDGNSLISSSRRWVQNRNFAIRRSGWYRSSSVSSSSSGRVIRLRNSIAILGSCFGGNCRGPGRCLRRSQLECCFLLQASSSRRRESMQVGWCETNPVVSKRKSIRSVNRCIASRTQVRFVGCAVPACSLYPAHITSSRRSSRYCAHSSRLHTAAATHHLVHHLRRHLSLPRTPPHTLLQFTRLSSFLPTQIASFPSSSLPNKTHSTAARLSSHAYFAVHHQSRARFQVKSRHTHATVCVCVFLSGSCSSKLRIVDRLCVLFLRGRLVLCCYCIIIISIQSQEKKQNKTQKNKTE